MVGTERGDTTCELAGAEAGEAVDDAVGEVEVGLTDRGDTTCGPEEVEAGGTEIGGTGKCVGIEAGGTEIGGAGKCVCTEAGGTEGGGAGKCVCKVAGGEAGRAESAGAVGGVDLSTAGDMARIGMGGAGI